MIEKNTQDKQRVIVLPGMGWMYHDSEDHLPIVMPDNQDGRLEAERHWCMAHRPAPECACGQYTLEWQ